MVSFRPLDIKRDLSSLLAFSGEVYGKTTYQASERYVRWLYEEHPAARGPQDCLLAVDGDKLVGCVHRMLLPARSGTQRFMFVSLQNHIVAPRLRGGAGMLLLRQAVRGEQAVFSPGVHGRLSEAYRRLGYGQIEGFWLIRPLAPVRGAIQMLRARLGHEMSPILRRDRLVKVSRHLLVSTAPETDAIEHLSKIMNRQAATCSGVAVEWTPDLVRWRYFSEHGPRHILVCKERGSCAVLSFGVRHGVAVVRLLEYEDGGDPLFMKDVVAVAQATGAGVMFAFTFFPDVCQQLLNGGWKRRKNAAVSFMMGPLASHGLSASAGASDFGFEAIRTEVV